MKNLKFYLKPFIPTYIVAIACLIATVCLEMVSPQIVKVIINQVFLGGDYSLFFWLLAGLVAVGLVKAVVNYSKDFLFDRNSQTICNNMRKDLFNHMQSLSMEYFHDTNTGELMARVKDDMDKVSSAFGGTFMLLSQTSLLLVMVSVIMFTMNPVLTILPFTVIVVGIAFGFPLRRAFDDIYGKLSEENAMLTSIGEENISGVRTVKAFAREQEEIDKFDVSNKRYYDLNMKQTKVIINFFPVYNFVGQCLPVVCAVIGGVYVVNGKMDLGSLVAYVEYSRSITWPINMIADLANQISAAFTSYKKIRVIADQKPIIVDGENVAFKVERGDLSFKNVSLKLDDNLILDDISFDLPAGKTLGIMGATGSGKSSIINLMQRFYDANEGAITLDGEDIKTLSLAAVRSASAVVMQDVFLFSDSIAENIKMGQRNSLSEYQVREAALKAQASDFIETMDAEYETVIGERGVGLSGGQKQRISIARALSKKAPILVFDDSTSALDMETELKIQKTLRQLKGVSKVIIAHRISSVASADEIIYLQDGRVAERGTHEQLMAAKGLYYKTYMVQYPPLESERREVV